MRPAVAFVVAVGAVGAAVGAASGLHTSATTPTAHAVAVSAPLVGAELVCPDAMERTVGQVSRITRIGVAVPSTTVAGAHPAGGTVTIGRLDGHRTTTLLTAPGRARVVGATSYQGDVVVAGRGGLAPGLSADELGRRDGGPYRGLDGVACSAPGDSAWLIGASTTVGAHAELRLANIDDSAAIVDVDLFGPHGVINARGATGLSVAPHRTRVVAVDTLAPAQSLLLVHVKADTGRVAVALRQQLQFASTPHGQDWVPLGTAPARSVGVPGLAAGLGPRALLIGNPGDVDATVSIRLIRGDVAFVPRGLSAVTVPAGSVASVDISKGLATKPGGAVVTSDRPVVAGASMNTGPRVTGIAEQAFTAGVPALSGHATAVVNYVRRRSSQLVLSAPAAAANVQVSTLAGVGPSGGHATTVHVAAGRTVVYDLRPLSRGQLLVAVTVSPLAGSGPVYAARDEFEFGANGPMFTVLPLVAAPVAATIPPAALDAHAR
ncbi:MAG: DUF5719 family protein [Actinomycetes bacterium]